MHPVLTQSLADGPRRGRSARVSTRSGQTQSGKAALLLRISALIALPLVTATAGALLPASTAWATRPGAHVPIAYVADVAINTPGPPITVGGTPEAIAITPNGKTAYVVNYVRNPRTVVGTVTPINTATNTPGPPIRVGGDPRPIAITPNGKTAYVANEGSSTVTPISTATDTPGPPIRVGGDPYAIAITPNGKTAYVASVVVGGPPDYYPVGAVTPINTATNTPGPPIKVGGEARAIAITPNGKTAYVVNDSTVTPISTATNTPGPPITAGYGAFAIAITPNGKTAYVASGVGLGVHPVGTVTPINTATNTPDPPIKVDGEPLLIAITPNGKTAYVVNGGLDTVTPINTATNTPGRPIKVGRNPDAIAITPNGKTAYVVNAEGLSALSPAAQDYIGTVTPIHI